MLGLQIYSTLLSGVDSLYTHVWQQDRLSHRSVPLQACRPMQCNADTPASQKDWEHSVTPRKSSDLMNLPSSLPPSDEVEKVISHKLVSQRH